MPSHEQHILPAGSSPPVPLDSAQALRHLRLMIATTLFIWLAVIGANMLTFRELLQPQHQAAIEMISGWARTYKPILFDRFRPRVASFGASWVRDAFDPEVISATLGKLFYNFGISGCQPYEVRRFLQSALSIHSLEAVIINLDSMIDDPTHPRTQFGFNEALLNVDAAGRANPFMEAQRMFAVTLSGASIGYNIEVSQALWKLNHGASKEDVIPSFDRYDYGAAAVRDRAALARAQVIDASAPAASVGAPKSPEPAVDGGLGEEFDRAMSAVCDEKVEVFLYTTPGQVLLKAASPPVLRARIAWYERLHAWNDRCGGRIHYFDFNYPNALTMEGVMNVPPRAEYFRRDGHPRPTVGEAMIAAMFPGTSAEVSGRLSSDFGTDLLALPKPAALAWIARTQERWFGKWVPAEKAATLADLAPPR
jgi:hypothetical protein